MYVPICPPRPGLATLQASLAQFNCPKISAEQEVKRDSPCCTAMHIASLQDTLINMLLGHEIYELDELIGFGDIANLEGRLSQ